LDAWVFICFTGRERGRVYPAKLVRLYHVLTSSKINQIATCNGIGSGLGSSRYGDSQPYVREQAGVAQSPDHRGH
jgi:hypothetical protein